MFDSADDGFGASERGEAAEILAVAASLIGARADWRQAGDGNRGGMCALEAINAATREADLRAAALSYLSRVAHERGYPDPILLNDCPHTSHRDVLSAFAEAYALASPAETALAY